MIIGVGTHFWGNALFILPQNMLVFEAEFLPHSIKMIPVIFSVSGMILAHILNHTMFVGICLRFDVSVVLLPEGAL